MRVTVVLGLSLILLLGCDSTSDCEDDDICDAVQSTHRVDRFEIHGRQSEVVEAAGKTHHVVHFEFGLGVNCDTSCQYSHLCTIYVDGADHVSSFAFNTRAEWLFDPGTYCDGSPKGMASTNPSKCKMPAYDLAAMGDAAFEVWVKESGEKYDMKWCRQSLSQAYDAGIIPKK